MSSSWRSNRLPPATFKSDLIEVRKSTLDGAGLGLFAVVDLSSNTCLGEYVGETMSIAEFNQRYPPYKTDSRYTYRMMNLHSIIVAREAPYLTANPSNYINEGLAANVVLKKRRLYTCRDVKAGEELFFRYPEDYHRPWLSSC